MIHNLMDALRTPLSLHQLAARLESSPAAVEGVLGLLEARGYVGRAYNQSPTCGTGCRACNLEHLCLASGLDAPSRRVWRLTAKGVRALSATSM